MRTTQHEILMKCDVPDQLGLLDDAILELFGGVFVVFFKNSFSYSASFSFAPPAHIRNHHQVCLGLVVVALFPLPLPARA